MTTNLSFDEVYAAAVRDAEKAQEVVLHLNAARELLTGKAKPVAKSVVKSATVTATGEAPKKRGRPVGWRKNKDGEAAKSGIAPTSAEVGEKRLELPALLVEIGAASDHPLTLGEFTEKVREAGYQSLAKNFSNMVYQSLLKLSKVGRFIKNHDAEKREINYQYVSSDAA